MIRFMAMACEIAPRVSTRRRIRWSFGDRPADGLRARGLLAAKMSVLAFAGFTVCGADWVVGSALQADGDLKTDVTAGSKATAPRPFVRERLLVKFHSAAGLDRTRVLAGVGGSVIAEIAGIGVSLVGLSAGSDERAAVETLRRRPEVVFAELDELFPPDATPNDPYFGVEWHLPKISAPAAWDVGVGSPSVIIAVLDTGVDGTHPDLAPKLVAGWNFYDNNDDTSDVYGHGTAVAGAAGAVTNNALGVAAVCWGCQLMPIRISDPQGYGSTSRIANGLVWAADRGARVANVSYRVSTSSTVQTAAAYFQDHGGVVTVAAGNETQFETAVDNPFVLTVSATTSNDALASWTNTGNNIDLAAPGSSIRTTNRGGGYGGWSGTSFSAPIVASAAGLLISTNPALSGAQVQEILKSSADDLGPGGWDTGYGWGRLNIARAVETAESGGGAAPIPTISDWGVMILALLHSIAATTVLRHRSCLRDTGRRLRLRHSGSESKSLLRAID